MNNTCVKHNFKSVHVSNLFWSREYNSAKEICKYPSFSKVGGNYPLDLENYLELWSITQSISVVAAFESVGNMMSDVNLQIKSEEAKVITLT